MVSSFILPFKPLPVISSISLISKPPLILLNALAIGWLEYFSIDDAIWTFATIDYYLQYLELNIEQRFLLSM